MQVSSRGISRHRRSGIVAAACILAVSASTGTALSETPVKGGTLKVAIETDVRGFDAVEGGVLGQSGSIVSVTMHEPLINYFPDGSNSPRLALSWEASDDLKSWTFKLREGVNFHDGTPFTATDVAHHYNRILDPKNKSRSRSFISSIQEAVVVDDHTVRFNLKHPWLPFLPFMGTRTMSGPIPSHKNVEAGKQNREPIGTGPFRFVSWSGGDRIVVERNEDYWDKDRINLDQVVFRILPDTQTRYASLKSGEVDVIWTDRGNTIVRAKKDPDITTHSLDGAGALITFFNTRKPPLDDPRVRAALSHAWSQEAVIKVTWKDTVPFATHPMIGHYECGDASYRHHDPKKAKELLAEYGKPVQISMIHTTTPRGRELGEIMQQLYKKVGVELTLEPVDQNTLVKKVFTNDYQISGWRIADGADIGPQLFALHHSKSSYNLTGYSTPELDELVVAQRTATDPEARGKMLCEISAIMNQSGHIQYRGGRRYHVFTRNNIKGIPTIWSGVADVTGAWIAQ